MAGSAAHLALLETLRSLKGLDNEGRLTEAAILVKANSGEFAKRDTRISDEELARSGIVQLASRTRCADCRLHVALSADTNEVPVTHIMEVHRRIKWLFRKRFIPGPLPDVLHRRTTAQFAVNSRLLEFHILHVKTAILHVFQLAVMTNSANGLISCQPIKVFTSLLD